MARSHFVRCWLEVELDKLADAEVPIGDCSDDLSKESLPALDSGDGKLTSDD